MKEENRELIRSVFGMCMLLFLGYLGYKMLYGPGCNVPNLENQIKSELNSTAENRFGFPKNSFDIKVNGVAEISRSGQDYRCRALLLVVLPAELRALSQGRIESMQQTLSYTVTYFGNKANIRLDP